MPVPPILSYLHFFVLAFVYLLMFAILARALASWFIRDLESGVMRFLFDVTEPFLAPLRRLIPGSMGMDVSPMLAVFFLFILGQVLG